MSILNRTVLPARRQPGILETRSPGWPALGRGLDGDRERVINLVRRVSLTGSWDPGEDLLQRWRRLAEVGRHDLVVARLVEGHADATAILAQAGACPVGGAMYGVWASGSGRTGLEAAQEPGDSGGWRVRGTMRFCSGATWLDRALVTARTPSGALLLLDLDVRGPGVRPAAGTWPAVGMDLSESLDIAVDLDVPAAAQVGPQGFYLERPGFAVGGIGVAAVWLGGAAGILDDVAAGLRRSEPDGHQLAHLGAMSTAVLGADAVLVRSAQAAGTCAAERLAGLALLARSAVEAAVGVVLERAPRLTGPTPLCRDGEFAHRFADLQVYVRQHHAERDLQALGADVLADDFFGPASLDGDPGPSDPSDPARPSGISGLGKGAS